MQHNTLKNILYNCGLLAITHCYRKCTLCKHKWPSCGQTKLWSFPTVLTAFFFHWSIL